MKRASLLQLFCVPVVLALAAGWAWAAPPNSGNTPSPRIQPIPATPVRLQSGGNSRSPKGAKDAAKDPKTPTKGLKTGAKDGGKFAKGGGGGILPPLNKAAAGAYKGLFYDNNFDYLHDPAYNDWHLGERLKRLSVGQAITLDVGGQYRARYHAERNIRNGGIPNGLGLTGRDDDFLLHRTRVYLNAEIGQRLRFYGEGLDAVSVNEDYTPRPIEENRLELQNLFLDVAVADLARGTLTARVGRQELLYGNQRLVSPLDWANTRRTFDGIKLMWQGDKWDVDGFWASNAIRKNPDYLTNVDPSDGELQLYGFYSTYKGLRQDKLDLFWLAHDNYLAKFQYDTIGTRYSGGRNNWLYEAELAYQFGKNTDDSDHSAGAITAGIGRKFTRFAWNPTLWFYYDWASGSNTSVNGYDHYYPLAHKYLGFMDLFGRKNIEDANILLTMSPQERVKFLAWFHVFRLQNLNDVPYNVTMNPYSGLGPGSSVDRDLGSELDMVLDLTLTERMDLLVGYSHFWAGDYYTAPGSAAPVSSDADFFYTQFTVNF